MAQDFKISTRGRFNHPWSQGNLEMAAAFASQQSLRAPPGLAASDGESSTASRERRRVAVVAREVTQALICEFSHRMGALEEKLDGIMAIMTDTSLQVEARFPLQSRVDRLETLFAISPQMSPCVDEVLSEIISRKKETTSGEPELELSPNKLECYNIFDEDDHDCEKNLASRVLFPSESVLMASNSTQTEAHARPRRHRCHGRATQTCVAQNASVQDSGTQHDVAFDSKDTQTDSDIRKFYNTNSVRARSCKANNLQVGDILRVDTPFVTAYQKNHLEVPTGTLLLLVGFDKDDDIMINFVLDLEGDSFKVCSDTMLGEDLKLCSKVIPIR